MIMGLDFNRILDEVLIPHEGIIQNGYRDTAKDKATGQPLGFFTVGIGNKASSADACAQLPWVRADGSQATPDEARACFAAVMAMAPGLRASAYASASPLRLTVDVCRDLAITRVMREFLPGLRRLFIGFDGYPETVQLALVDEIYQVGEGSLWGFANLRAACARGAWERAAIEIHVSDASPERNAWRAKMVRAAIAAPAGPPG